MVAAGDVVHGERTGAVHIQARIGGGLQGEVFRAESAYGPLAVKWYNPPWSTPEQARAIDELIARGSPDPRFLWPVERLGPYGGAQQTFGYTMPLCEPGYFPLVRLVNGTLSPSLEPSTEEIIRICQHAVESFRLLHLSGLCYRDVSLANVFFEPRTANIRICDVDNVGVDDGSSKVLGTPLFMAPEIVRDTSFRTFPSRSTDLHSLAVLLFFLLFMEHPLIGRKVDSGLWDEQHALIHFGREPVFVLAPDNDSNRPTSAHVERYWALYPQFLRDRMLTAFGEGLHSPSARVTEGEWLRTLGRLRDCIGSCPNCAATVFHDLAASNEVPCHQCGRPLARPLVLSIGRRKLVVSRQLRFGAEVTSPLPSPGPPIAEAVPHPNIADRFGLKNLTGVPWTVTMPDGVQYAVGPRQAIDLVEGTTIATPTFDIAVHR